MLLSINISKDYTMEYLLLFLFGVFIGNRITIWMVRKTLMRLLAPNIQTIELPVLTTNAVGSAIFLFDHDTFMCQGSTIDEVAQNFLSIKKIKLAMVKHNGETIWFNDGKVQSSLE
jgi:hypothetical protein